VQKDGGFAGDPTFLSTEADSGKTGFFAGEVNPPLLPGLTPIGGFKNGFLCPHQPTMLGIGGKGQVGKGGIRI
jgi:hypothetical protein